MDFYNDISMRLIQDVTNDGGCVFFAMGYIHKNIKSLLSVCAALITINDVSCYFIISFFFREVEVVSYFYNAAVLVCCSFAVLSCICVCCAA